MRPLPDRPLLMGILNVTPDSFSEGGRYGGVDDGLRMADEGADLVDVGGESTRPGAEPVPTEVELGRVIPVIHELARRGVAVSIDTMKAPVAREALAAGATFVNDVTAFADPEMGPVCASAGAAVCLMHMQGTPQTMQVSPSYGDVTAEVREYLLARAAYAYGLGIPKESIWIDPGIGFGKTVEHNLALLRHLGSLVDRGYPVLVGVSRKGFIGRVLGGAPVDDRLEGTLAVQVLAQAAGVKMIRAHDVTAARRAIDMAAAVLNSN